MRRERAIRLIFWLAMASALAAGVLGRGDAEVGDMIHAWLGVFLLANRVMIVAPGRHEMGRSQ